MSGGRSIDKERKSPRESGEDSEDESEILEESPCGRWLKRREEVEQRDVPGIDCAHLAMDTEEGVEVVWNEVQFSERKNFKAQEDKIQLVFDNLTRLEHPNIVKFHRYWTDTHNDKPRVIFITEYMSCGSLKQFLKRTKRNVKRLPLQAWKRWCTQILSALSYLHGCVPPIVHGNLTCDTIFIQHNGLVKIGSVAPDAIHHHVKTCRENMRNMHLIAPEYGSSQMVTPAMDIYSFGMCALETAALEIQGNGDSGSHVTEEHIVRTVESLEEPRQKDFIYRCINKDPAKRPTARELLFHPLLFEVHSLKLLAAHTLVNTTANISETITDEVVCGGGAGAGGAGGALAWCVRAGRRCELAARDLQPHAEKLEKFVEDVRHLPADGVRVGRPPRRLALRARGRERARLARAARPGDAPRRQHDVQPQAARAPRRARPADDDPAAHGRQDEPAADVRRVPPRLRARARARARAARLHTRGGPRQAVPADRGVSARQLRPVRARAPRAARQLVPPPRARSRPRLALRRAPRTAPAPSALRTAPSALRTAPSALRTPPCALRTRRPPLRTHLVVLCGYQSTFTSEHVSSLRTSSETEQNEMTVVQCVVSPTFSLMKKCRQIKNIIQYLNFLISDFISLNK